MRFAFLLYIFQLPAALEASRIKSMKRKKTVRTRAAAENSALKSEGDLNLSQNRNQWLKKHINEESQYGLDEDGLYFLPQSLPTPCLNVLKSCKGIYIKDLDGRRY